MKKAANVACIYIVYIISFAYNIISYRNFCSSTLTWRTDTVDQYKTRSDVERSRIYYIPWVTKTSEENFVNYTIIIYLQYHSCRCVLVGYQQIIICGYHAGPHIFATIFVSHEYRVYDTLTAMCYTSRPRYTRSGWYMSICLFGKKKYTNIILYTA